MEIHFKGGDTADITRYEPEQLPTVNDTVIFDQCTEDVYANNVPFWGALKMTNFKKDIYYCFPYLRQSGCFRNHERYDIFLYREDIRRID